MSAAPSSGAGSISASSNKVSPGSGSATRPARLGWALFDWAQQPYYTLIGSFVFRPYYVAAVAATPAIGQVHIGLTGTIAGLFVAIAGPLLGIALERGHLKAWLGWTSLPFIIACFGLWWALPGGAASIPLILLFLTVAAAFAEMTTTVNNAMLPPIAAPGTIGRLSGYGVALGCLGGLVSAALLLLVVLLPEVPPFGLDAALREPERLVGPFSALWYVVFVLPLFLFYPRDVAIEQRARPLGELWRLVRSLPANRTMLWFFIGRMLSADALGAIQIFGGIIASTVFGWGPVELVLFGLLILSSGGLGALLAGRIDDSMDSRTTVLWTCVVLALALAGLGSISATEVLWIIPVEPAGPETGFLGSTAEQVFLGFAILLGLATGPMVSSQRAWMARLSPPGEEGRWFGLYAVAGRATAFAAPLMVALGTLLTGDTGAVVPVILGFLLAGIAAFWRVPETSPGR